MGESERWRPVVAALANDDARLVFARLCVGTDGDPFRGMSPSRRAHVRQQLAAAEMIHDVDGTVTLHSGVFTDLLRGAAVSRPTGIHRFIRENRIVQYPARPAERRELLEWVAGRVLRRGEVISEADMNDRLAVHTDDVAALRRYLVDAELVERTATGSEYALPE